MHENIKINVLYEGNMMNKEGKKKKEQLREKSWPSKEENGGEGKKV